MRKVNENKVAEVLACIQQKQFETGRSPSIREIMKLCNISSIALVQNYIKLLKNRRQIDNENDGTLSVDFRFSGKSVSVALLGTIACGEPIFAVENYEGVYRLPIEFVTGSGEHFMLRAKGDSMTGVNINDGDLLIFRQQPSADYGEIVAALIEDEATVKTYLPKKDKALLKAENPNYADIEVKHDDCKIIGVLISSVHRHKK